MLQKHLKNGQPENKNWKKKILWSGLLIKNKKTVLYDDDDDYKDNV